MLTAIRQWECEIRIIAYRTHIRYNNLMGATIYGRRLALLPDGLSENSQYCGGDANEKS